MSDYAEIVALAIRKREKDSVRKVGKDIGIGYATVQRLMTGQNIESGSLLKVLIWLDMLKGGSTERRSGNERRTKINTIGTD